MGCSVVLCTVMTSSSCSPSRKHAVGVFLSPPLAAPRAAVFAAPRLVAARAFSTGSLDLVLRQADSALADVAKAKALIMAAKWNDLDAEELEDLAHDLLHELLARGYGRGRRPVCLRVHVAIFSLSPFVLPVLACAVVLSWTAIF